MNINDPYVNARWPNGIPVIAGGAPTPEEEAAAAAQAEADKAAEAAKAAAPGVTREEFAASQATQAQIAATLETVNATLARLSEQRVVERQPVVSEAITDDQYEEAIRLGDGKTARQYVEQERAKDRAAMEQRVGQVEAVGAESLAGVVELTAVATLPYYKTYEKEIQDIIKTMPIAGRVNPKAQRKAYDMVIGGHIDEIAAAEREKANRSANNPANAGRPGGSGPQRTPAGGTQASEVPTPRDLGGEESESALSQVGRDADRQAQGMGYKTWADYMEKTKEYR